MSYPERQCMTRAMACFLCCIVSGVSWGVQSGLMTHYDCDTEFVVENNTVVPKVKKCPGWVVTVNYIIGCISCLVCIFATIKMVNVSFMC